MKPFASLSSSFGPSQLLKPSAKKKKGVASSEGGKRSSEGGNLKIRNKRLGKCGGEGGTRPVDAGVKFNLKRVMGHVFIFASIDRTYLGTERWRLVVWRECCPGHQVYKGKKRTPPFLPSQPHRWRHRFDMPVATSDDTAPEGYTTVYGYYRFTDVFYEWYAP